MATLAVCLRLPPKGLALAGPPRSWFIFLSSSLHRRTAASPAGDLSELRVRLSNVVAADAVALLNRLAARDCFVMVEQPANSLMFHFEPFAAWKASDPRLDVVMTYMGCFGHDMQKPTKLLTSMMSAYVLQRAKPRVKVPTSSDGSGWPAKYLRGGRDQPAGGRDLQSSAVYTRDVVHSLSLAWEREHLRDAAPLMLGPLAHER